MSLPTVEAPSGGDATDTSDDYDDGGSSWEPDDDIWSDTSGSSDDSNDSNDSDDSDDSNDVVLGGTNDDYSESEDEQTASGDNIIDAIVDYQSDMSGDPIDNTQADADSDESGGTRAWDTGGDGSTDVITGGHDMDGSTDEEGIVDTTPDSPSTVTEGEDDAEVYDPADGADWADNTEDNSSGDSSDDGPLANIDTKHAAIALVVVAAVLAGGL